MTKILLTTTEAVPFAKTGGLADVCGALPIALANLGHDVTVMMPAFRDVYEHAQSIESTDIDLEIPIGTRILKGELLSSQLPNSDVQVYFVHQDDYYNRAGLYGEDGADYRDNCQRFVFFCRSVMEAIRLLELEVDVLHCNDWQTGLIPALLDAEYRGARGYEAIATLYTIHNLAYQGRFWHWDMLLTGLDWRYFNWRQLEFFGDLNFLKGGIVFADAISTVSPRYAQEIQRSPLGCGLEGVLYHRRDSVTGILNGADYDVWSPDTDAHLACCYGLHNWQDGKAKCKAALQATLGLAPEPHVPLIGMIGRLAEQKGAELVLELLRKWIHQQPVQWAVLGSGDPKVERKFMELANEFPQRLAARMAFSDELAHEIEAGADLFLMPSRYEPCGLNQMYSLKYGAVPVVHATGGLYDTIIDCNEDTLASGKANGFSFGQYDLVALESTLSRALDTYQSRQDAWQQLVTTGMRQDWSWTRSARQYVDLYQETISRVRQAVCA